MVKSFAVIGVGNPFRGDDGIGVFLIQKLIKDKLFSNESIDLIEGGIGGMNLFHLIGSYKTVILIDAVDFNASPGECIFFSSDDIGSSNKIPSTVSTHGEDVFSVLKTVIKYTDNPPRIFIFGIQPKKIAMSEGFSEKIQQNIPVYLRKISKQIREKLRELD